MPYADTDLAMLREFGQRVREARKARKWSQEALAERVGIDRTYVGRIERGEQSSGLVVVNKLALALDESFAGFLPCRAKALQK